MRSSLLHHIIVVLWVVFSQEIKPFDTIKTEKQVVEEIEKKREHHSKNTILQKQGCILLFSGIWSIQQRNIGKSQLFGEL